jgi:hypothetical protein
MTIVECKWWNHSVTRDRITHLKHVREQVGANKAVCFTSVDFQSGAETAARAHDIGLFLVKEMSDLDWGRPGRVIDFFIQIHQAAFSPIAFPKALLFAPSGAASQVQPRVTMNESTELRSVDGKSTLKVIDLYAEIRRIAFQHANMSKRIWHGGADGSSYVAIKFAGAELIGAPFELQVGRFPALASEFACDVIFEVRQQRITMDRGENLNFALVVEDYLMGTRYAASRKVGAVATELTKLGGPPPPDQGPSLENGSIMCVLVDGFLDYSKLRAAKSLQDPGTELIPE